MTIGSIETPGTEFPAQTIYTDADLYYVPFVAEDGRVGYRIGKAVRADGPRGDEAAQEAFIYLNPSTSTDGPNPALDVFVYTGIENDPTLDEAEVFILIDDGTFGGTLHPYETPERSDEPAPADR